MTFDGYNFEDAILIVKSWFRDDGFTSIHIDESALRSARTKAGAVRIHSRYFGM